MAHVDGYLDDNELYGNLLAELRAFRGRENMTQAQLAESAGIHVATLTRRIATPRDFTLDELRRIARALNISLHISMGEVTVVNLETKVTRSSASRKALLSPPLA